MYKFSELNGQYEDEELALAEAIERSLQVSKHKFSTSKNVTNKE
jgi:hypothetical protein